MRSLSVTSLALAILATLACLAASPAGARPDLLVPTEPSETGFGPFEEGGDPVAELRDAFGQPSSSQRGEFECRLSWRKYGVTAQVALVGTASGNPCRTGNLFLKARLTNSGWHTPQGVSPGSSEAKARREAVRDCVDGFNPGRCAGERGYVLGLHRNDCAAARTPSVTAKVREGEVKALIVFSHGCE